MGAWEDELIPAYLEHARRVREREPTGAFDWAFDRVSEIIETQDPSIAYQMVTSLVEKASEDLWSYLAAGPVEDLLCTHGPVIVGSILKLAKNRRWKTVLGGVWGQGRMEPAVWQQLEKARTAWQLHH